MPGREDHYYRLAKRENFRSRAAYKLQGIDRKFGFIAGHDNVLEFGAAPGGWTQYVLSVTRGVVLSVDISPMVPLERMHFLKGDIMSPLLPGKITSLMVSLGVAEFDCMISDAMVHTSGDRSRDHSSSYLLDERIMEIGLPLLKRGGNALVKQFHGDLTRDFVGRWGRQFSESHITTPAASRKHSSEIYIVFLGKL